MSKTTSRRKVLKIAAGGGIAAGLGLTMRPGNETSAAAQNFGSQAHHGHGPRHKRVRGPFASATVAFGQWAANPEAPLDRHPNLAPLDRNGHLLIPDEVTIEAGGVVQFLVAGAHQIAIYDHGTRPDDINTNLLIPPFPGGPPILIDDPRKRIYRGLNFVTLPILSVPPPLLPPPASPQFLTDRLEVVQFPKPGNYLVICTIVFHFMPAPGEFEMYGYVRVHP
jgi:hypothetical protein